MPFLGQDPRGPGLKWQRAESTKWESIDPTYGVNFETVPRSHVRKIIEAFLRQMQQTKSKNAYTSLTSAPISKCSVRENMAWLQVGLMGSKECHGYTTLGEMIRRLDFCGSAQMPHRFSYVLQIAQLLVKNKFSTLSGTAQQHMFKIIDVLVGQVIDTQREIRHMHNILHMLMSVLQQQSKKRMFSSKTTWLNKLEIVRKWQSQLNQIDIPHRMDNRLTLNDLPVELQQEIASCLNDYNDVSSLGQVSKTFQEICDSMMMWKDLCYKNFTKVQVSEERCTFLIKVKTDPNLKKFLDENGNVPHPSNVNYWKTLHAILRKSYSIKEEMYIDPLLYCRHCSILYWKDSGHPCIKVDRELIYLSPNEVVSFFER